MWVSESVTSSRAELSHCVSSQAPVAFGPLPEQLVHERKRRENVRQNALVPVTFDTGLPFVGQPPNKIPGEIYRDSWARSQSENRIGEIARRLARIATRRWLASPCDGDLTIAAAAKVVAQNEKKIRRFVEAAPLERSAKQL